VSVGIVRMHSESIFANRRLARNRI